MKRSIGSLFVGLMSLVFSLGASATAYSGGGTWQSSSGDAGTYTVAADIEIDGDELSIEQTLDFGDWTLEVNRIIQKVDETFFNVINADTDEAIGSGYCHVLPSLETTLCHSNSFENDDLIEVTIRKTTNKIYRMGSKTNLVTGHITTWIDELAPSANN